MKESELTTSTLLNRLFKTSSLTRFIRHHDVQWQEPPFNCHLQGICQARGLVAEHVIKKSGIERTYGHQLFNGRRKPSRDKAIQLALGFGMDFQETQGLLKTAHKSALTPKIKRDVVFIYALEHRLPIEDIQLTLQELGLPLLGKEDRYD